VSNLTQENQAAEPVEDLDLDSQLDTLLQELESLEPGLIALATSGKAPAAAAPAAEIVSDEPTAEAEPAEAIDEPEVESESESLEIGSTTNQIDALLSQQLAGQLGAVATDQEVDAVDGVVEVAIESAIESELAELSTDPSGEGLETPTGSGAGAGAVAIEESDGSDSMSDQLDALISQEVGAEPVGEISGVESEAQPVAETEASGGVVVESSLEGQLDQMLNNPESVDTEAGKTTIEAASPGPELSGPVTADANSQEDFATLDQIDQLLASEAESTVTGDFETPEDVKADEHSKQMEEAAQLDTPMPAPPALCADDSDLAARARERAQSAAENPDSDGFDANAQAVADELDSQPELAAGADAAGVETQQPVEKARVVICARVLRKTLALVNRPLVGLSPQIRDAVGYFALLHLFMGSVLLIGKITGII